MSSRASMTPPRASFQRKLSAPFSGARYARCVIRSPNASTEETDGASANGNEGILGRPRERRSDREASGRAAAQYALPGRPEGRSEARRPDREAPTAPPPGAEGG